MEAPAKDLLVLFFQPFLPPIIMIWLWILTVKHFETKHIDYSLCFNARDRKYLASSSDTAELALVVTATLCSFGALFSYLCSVMNYKLAAFIPLVLYASIAIFMLLPLNLMYRMSRLFFCHTMARVLLPFQEVSWADFLMADMFTSLSKSSADFCRALCYLMTGPALPFFQVASTELPSCSPLATPTIAAMCLPYLIRFIQCLLVFRVTKNTAQVFNAAKYATAFPALILAAFEHEAHMQGKHFPLLGNYLTCQLLNSLYSFYWDVEQDWDMPWIVQSGTKLGPFSFPALKADILFSRHWYWWVIFTNLLLRCSWSHRLIGTLECQQLVPLILAVLEVVRRWQWSYIRIETELRKISAKMVHGHTILSAQLPSVQDKVDEKKEISESSSGGMKGLASGYS